MSVQEKIIQLQKTGDDFSCPLFFPPFDGNTNEFFFDINEFKEKIEFQKFIGIIGNSVKHYEYAKRNNKIFMVINKKDIQ